MKTILFCNLPYDFSILKPLADELARRGYAYLWYVPPSLFVSFPYKSMIHTNSLELVKEFQAEALFVAGVSLPHGLGGLKVRVFHSLAGKKRGILRFMISFISI